MATMSFYDRNGVDIRRAVGGASAQAALWELGIASGRWAPKTHAVSQTPQLVYARELHQLQQDHASAFTDRVIQRPTAQRGDPRDQHRLAWPEPRAEHVHSDAEVRVVLRGCARWLVRAPVLGGWAAVTGEAGDWLVLPAGLPHSFEASATQGVEMLRLFARHGGWVHEPTAVRVPAALKPWNGQTEVISLPWAYAA